MNRTLIVFAKEPEKGTVKTRLASTLGEDGCARLYRAFLKDIFKVVSVVQVEHRIVAYSAKRAPRFLKKCAPGWILYKQIASTLGKRMHAACEYVHALGSKRTVIIGTDSPTLPVHLIARAFRKLRERDIVLGPSTDGGFYLIGVKEPDTRIFEQVNWSTSHVLNQTMQNIEKIGKTYWLLDPWYDVDTPNELKQLAEEFAKNTDITFAAHTRRALAQVYKT